MRRPSRGRGAANNNFTQRFVWFGSAGGWRADKKLAQVGNLTRCGRHLALRSMIGLGGLVSFEGGRGVCAQQLDWSASSYFAASCASTAGRRQTCFLLSHPFSALCSCACAAGVGVRP